jgi:hypothetical protein
LIVEHSTGPALCFHDASPSSSPIIQRPSFSRAINEFIREAFDSRALRLPALNARHLREGERLVSIVRSFSIPHQSADGY